MNSHWIEHRKKGRNCSKKAIFEYFTNNQSYVSQISILSLHLQSNFETMADLIKLVEQEFAKARETQPAFKPGDTVNVHVKIKEGNKERVQQFQGTVIQRKGGNSNGESFTVRKVSNGVGVERIFPVISPSIDKIEVVKVGSVRRAKLYYLKGKHGKAARIKEKI